MRKVKEHSRHNQQKDLFADVYGPLTNEDTDWTNEQINQLLDAFLIEECRYLSARNCLRKITGRSTTAVSSMLWKLAVNYKRKSVRDYEPGRRMRNRAGAEWTIRDKAVIELATGQEGQKNGAGNVNHVAKILGRTDDEVADFYLECKAQLKKKNPFNTIPQKDESTATLVNRVLRGSHGRLMEEIGL